MANLFDNYKKTTTGDRLEIKTSAGVPPTNSITLANLNAPQSTSTITAPINMVTDPNGAVLSWASGDVMFYSDGYTIYDSAGNTMNGWTAGSTGAHRAAAQGVLFAKVPDLLMTSAGFDPADVPMGTLYWCFFNGMEGGIHVGVIDMNGNSGLGTFRGYLSLGADGLNTSGIAGRLQGTENGTCGRMTSCCYVVDEDVIGLVILSKPWSDIGANNQWCMNKITEISGPGGTAPGCPLLSSAFSNGVLQTYGTATAQNAAGRNGIVRCTRVEATDETNKIATIYVEEPGLSSDPLLSAIVNIMTLDAVTTTLTNSVTFTISMLDYGALAFPHPPGHPSRYFAKWLEWSHQSDGEDGVLYIPNYNTITDDLDINWYTINVTNAIGAFGSTPVHDNGGNKIWGGLTHPGRIVAGMWADPQNTGEIYIHTPEVMGLTASFGANDLAFSGKYPEIYGEIGSGNIIQHCIMSDCNDPVATAPSIQMYGTIDPSTLIRYGAPAMHYCSDTSAPATEHCISACDRRTLYCIDANRSLWVAEYLPAGYTSVRELTQFPVYTNLIDGACDAYTGQMFLYHGTGVALKWGMWNVDTNIIVADVSVVVNADLATWASFTTFATPLITAATAPGSMTPAASICGVTWFLALQAGSLVDYGQGKLNRSLATVSAFSGTSDFNVTTDFSGDVAGMTPVDMAMESDLEGLVYVLYVAIGKRLLKFVKATNTWTHLADNPAFATNITSISWSTDSASPKLLAFVGAAGAQKTYEMNTTTGVGTAAVDVETLPGGYAWAFDAPISFTEQHARYWAIAPVVATPAELSGIDTLCVSGDVWYWTDNSTEEPPIGCYYCHACITDSYVDYPNMCPSQEDVDYITSNCTRCIPLVGDLCKPFLPCCWDGIGPVFLPGVGIGTGIINGEVYSVSSGGSTPVCAVAQPIANPGPRFWMSMANSISYGGIVQIHLSGSCTTPPEIIGPFIPNVEDIAFDKHGNCLITQNNELWWGGAWTGYAAPMALLDPGFSTPKCLDTDYSINNYIIGADNIIGTATFSTYDHLTVPGTITLVATVTNATISVGEDIAVDPSTGDWWLLGDVTGGADTNDLMIIDDATGNHTLIADLTAILSLNSTEYCCGIEAIEYVTGLTTLFIITREEIGASGTYYVNYYSVENAVQIGTVLALLNPTNGSAIWDDYPTGLAINNICQKWLNNTSPVTVWFNDCTVCLADLSTDNCCYKCTDCTDPGNFFYSTTSVLYPYSLTTEIWRDATDICWETEVSQVCASPIVATIASGPYLDCPACAVVSTIYYTLTNCNNPADILYTDDTFIPTIGSYVGTVVNLTGECFCREVAVNPTGPQGTEAVYTIVNTAPDCAHCRYYIQLNNCLGGGGVNPAVIYVDYANSPTIVAAMALGQAHNVTIGATGMVDCYEIVNACLGPTPTVWPTGVIGTSSVDCATCAGIGLTCLQATWCCDPTVAVTVYDTSGITAADNGLVVEADITILGLVYSGCWEIVAPGILCDLNTITDANVNTINSSTVGSGTVPDCASCLNSPCNDPCVLLKGCHVGHPDITVTGAQGVLIGTSVVDFSGSPPGCYYVCTANLIHGTYWFWGHEEGIDWAGGNVAAVNLNGQSDMTTASQSAIETYCWRASCVHCVETNVTFTDTGSGLSTTYGPGDLMFYSDGKYVYDSTHTLMTDQTGTILPQFTPLLGGGGVGGYTNTNSASQQCIVVPNADPIAGKTNGVYNEYWLFYQTVQNGPLLACRIDMRENDGKGQVITASVDEVVEASSCEALCSTNSQAITEEWFVYDLPVMTHCHDWNNQHVRGRKIDGLVGIGSSFVAGDMREAMAHFGVEDPLSMANVKLKVDYQNRQLGLLTHSGTLINECHSYDPAQLDAKEVGVIVFSLDMVSGKCDGPGGTQWTNGWNGGAYNGSYSIVSNVYSNWQQWVRDFEFSPSGDKYYHIYGGANVGPPRNCALERINLIDSFTSGVANTNWQIYSRTTFNALPDMPAGSGQSPNDMPQGWDMQLAPDGKIYVVMNQGPIPNVWTYPSGNQVGNTSLLVIEDPDSTNTSSETYANSRLTTWNLGSRQIGTGLPTYLSGPCPCDPLNITTPTINNTYLSCSDAACTTPPIGCYKLTECICTGGTAFNSCAVNNPGTMPPNMVTYGKTWSPVCDQGSPERWIQIKDAVQALGTTLVPGTNQMVTFTYSFLMPGGNVAALTGGNAGPTVAVEQLAGATGINWTGVCTPYPKSYIQSHAEWKLEIASMFNEVKLLLEGMFNTGCGYGADLTVTFNDVGYESDARNLVTPIVNPGNGSTFTNTSGVTNIGDFCIGLSDWGHLDGCPCAAGCSSGLLAGAFNAPLSACVPGMNKAQPFAGTLLFDVNEDWRSDLLGQAVTGNTFSIKRTGIHEILHTLGYGHDFLTFGVANNCDVDCGCPCYQSQVSCPNIYGGGCPGFIDNMDALMGAFATQQAFATDFPTGLLGAEGIYDRRATCGIYGEPDPNYGCMDGVCIGGCNYVIEYSDDPALSAYVGGTIIWDNGDAAGERCWKVEWESLCPAPPPPLVNPVLLVSGNALTDCIACEGPGGCWELDLCPCNTIPGAPAQIITDTDMTFYCGGGPAIVEVDLYPGACYEVNCTPVPCPPVPVTIVVTNSYYDCQTCCDVNQWCYELCPCGPTVTADTCSSYTDISPGVTYMGSGFALEYISQVANAPLNSTDMTTLKFGDWMQLPSSLPCPVAGTPPGFMRHFIPVVSGKVFRCYYDGTMAPPPGFQASYNKWTDFLADCVTLLITGITNPATPYIGINVLIDTHFGYSGTSGDRVVFQIADDTCDCTTVSTCDGRTQVTPGVGYTPANAAIHIGSIAGGLQAVDFTTLQIELIVGVIPPGGCAASGTNWWYYPIKIIPVEAGATPTSILPGFGSTFYTQWDDMLADAMLIPIAGVTMTTEHAAFETLLAAHYGFACVVESYWGPCQCQTGACVTVTNNLSVNVGDIVTVGPGAPLPLLEDTCYVVGDCGPCTTTNPGTCTPQGAVTISPPYASCIDCENTICTDCYRLVDCTDPLIQINNVCATVDLDNAYTNGDIIQINGNTHYCYHVECESPAVCDPATCIMVSVTATFVSCAACLQVPLWECIPATGCHCVQSASGTHGSQAACLAAPPCCPTVTEYECEIPGCNCVPCLGGSCPPYNVGPTSAHNLAACLADTTSCCDGDPTYNCVYDATTNTYNCYDPGNGSGWFNNPGTALVDCNAAVAANISPCQIPSWNCDPISGACTDPGTGLGTWNNTNGGLAACIACVGCVLDPDCPGTVVTYDCDPIYCCIQNWLGTGAYPDITTCVASCTCQDPEEGVFEGDCVNCFSEIEMKSLLEKVSDVCEECNLPYGLTEQETICDEPCFGNANVYFFLDVTSAFGGSYIAKLQAILNFKVNVIEPAFALLKAANPSYGGHLYIIPGAWPTGGTFGPCNDVNNTGAAAPGSLFCAEAWLQWAQYPLSGNAGANGSGVNPMATGTLPAAQRVILQHTMVDGIGGAPFNCNGGAYDPTVHAALIEQILILPGAYSDDGFTQVNPWHDGLGKEGFSDPYHEFEGNDLSAICILFQDESVSGYYGQNGQNLSSDEFTNPLGTCGAPLLNGVPATDWNEYGLAPTTGLTTTEWRIDYHNYMSLHEFGWDVNGVSNIQPHNVTQKVFLYAGSYVTPGPAPGYSSQRWQYHYHVYQAIGGTKGTVSTQGHIDCADYIPVPAVFEHQCYAVTDPSIPNMYMGNLGGGDPALTTGYKGGSLSEYDFSFFIPEFEIINLTSEDLYALMKEYLSDCGDS